MEQIVKELIKKSLTKRLVGHGEIDTMLSNHTFSIVFVKQPFY